MSFFPLVFIHTQMDSRADFEQTIEMPDLAHFRAKTRRPLRCASFSTRHVSHYDRPGLTVPAYQIGLVLAFLFGLVLLMERFLRQ